MDSAKEIYDDSWVMIEEPHLTVTRLGEQDIDAVSKDAYQSCQSPRDLVPTLNAMRERASKLLDTIHPGIVFQLDITRTAIDTTFRLALPTAKLQQEFNCTCCRRFMSKIGGLSHLDTSTGKPVPLFWEPNDWPPDFRPAVEAVVALITSSKILKPFTISTRQELHVGSSESGGYSHMAFDFPECFYHEPSPYESSFPPTAVPKLTQMLKRVMYDYNDETIEQASGLIINYTLPQACRYRNRMQWLWTGVGDGGLLKRAQAASPTAQHNLYTFAATASTVGTINSLRSGVLGELLKACKAGQDFESIKSMWSNMVGPLSYMRPKADPTVGAVDAANKLFQKMGLTEDDLRREWLFECDVPAKAWIYRDDRFKSNDGIKPAVFAKVPSKPSKEPSASSTIYCTFADFINKHAARAMQIEYLLPSFSVPFFLITGLPGSKPLFKWHTTDLPYRASHYVYPNPRPSVFYNLEQGWIPVRGIISFPRHWPNLDLAGTLPLPTNDEGLIVAPSIFSPNAQPSEYHFSFGEGVSYMLTLDGIRDNSAGNDSLALFPSCLKHDFHGMRKTIEAYSNTHDVEFPEGRDADQVVGGIEISRELFGNADRWRHDNGSPDPNTVNPEQWEELLWREDRLRVTDYKGRTKEIVFVGFQ